MIVISLIRVSWMVQTPHSLPVHHRPHTVHSHTLKLSLHISIICSAAKTNTCAKGSEMSHNLKTSSVQMWPRSHTLPRSRPLYHQVPSPLVSSLIQYWFQCFHLDYSALIWVEAAFGFSLLTFVPAGPGATRNLGLCSWTVSGPCPFRSHLFINPPGTRFIRLISLIKAAVTWREREPWARQLGHLSNPHPLNALYTSVCPTPPPTPHPPLPTPLPPLPTPYPLLPTPPHLPFCCFNYHFVFWSLLRS